MVFDAWILPSRVVDSSKKVPDLNCEVQDLLLEVVGHTQEVLDLRSGKISPPNLTPGGSKGGQLPQAQQARGRKTASPIIFRE